MSVKTIVFTDVVGSAVTKRDTSLERDNAERDKAYLDRVQVPHFNLVRKWRREHGGQEVNTIGDAFYLLFDAPWRRSGVRLTYS